MDVEDIDDQIVLAVEGKIQLVAASQIQSSLDCQEMAAKSTSTVSAIKKSNSSPCGTNSQKSYLYLPRKGEYNKEREESNELAFQAWLRKKSELELQRRSVQPMSDVSAKNEERKKMNEMAFTAWLEKKKSFAAADAKAQKPVQNTGQLFLKYNHSFEEWKKKKELEQLKQTAIENCRKKELVERTGQLNPDLAKKAYRRWLIQKKNQAKEAAALKGKCRKLFIQESRDISRSLRFQGF